MRVRQSQLKLWQRCPLLIRYQEIDGLEREISGSIVYGWILHDCVLFLEESQDLDAAIERFKAMWVEPLKYDTEWRVDYWVRGTNWKKFFEQGPELLTNWWSLIRWETDHVFAREYSFEVPIGRNGHTLAGTVDKLVWRYRADIDQWVVLISDYKSNKKTPTYDYLAEDLQFSAYAYATTIPEFWDNLPGGRGREIYEETKDAPRYGEWVQLTGAKRMDAGIREERHYTRLGMAVDAMADSIAMRIFVPNISGDTCRYCEFRKPCGLPELVED